MTLTYNYKTIINKMNSNPLPNNNMQDFNYNVIHYYNQYCASPKTTQDRRIKRNYIMYLASIR